MNEGKYRISKTTATMMIITAAFFDLLQLACKILIFIGLTAIGTIVGAWLGAKIGFTGTGAVVGGIAGAVATFTGIGSVLAIKVGIILSEIFSIFFMIVGYGTMSLWFATKNVFPLSGSRMEKKMITTTIAVVVDFIPFLNMAPGITLWTITMIYLSREEDREDNKKDARSGKGARLKRRYAEDMAPEEQYA